MMRYIAIILLFLLLTQSPKSWTDGNTESWIINNEEITAQFNDTEIAEALSHKVLSKNKGAMATCFNSQISTKCYAFISGHQEGTTIDITQAFNASLGKITIHKDSFEKYKASPIKFLEEESHYLIEFKTQAWVSEQRYSVKWAIAITKDGKPIYQ